MHKRTPFFALSQTEMEKNNGNFVQKMDFYFKIVNFLPECCGLPPSTKLKFRQYIPREKQGIGISRRYIPPEKVLQSLA